MPEPGLTGDWNDPPTEGARTAGETSLGFRVVVQPEQGVLRYLETKAVVALEVVRRDSPSLVAEQSGRDDGVVVGGEVETLVSVDTVGGQTGGVLHYYLSCLCTIYVEVILITLFIYI